MKNYTRYYNRLTRTLKKYPILQRGLVLTNMLLTQIMYLAYACLIFYLGFFRRQWFTMVSYILLSGFSFAIVSFVRKYLNAKRPYEEWMITPLIARNKRGNSFPSRHVFSATLISMAVLSISSVWGILLLAISLFLAIIRVVGGVHYPRDVLAGYLLGVLIGILFLYL